MKDESAALVHWCVSYTFAKGTVGITRLSSPDSSFSLVKVIHQLPIAKFRSLVCYRVTLQPLFLKVKTCSFFQLLKFNAN